MTTDRRLDVVWYGDDQRLRRYALKRFEDVSDEELQAELDAETAEAA